jgi:15-cis-phytoene synthase
MPPMTSLAEPMPAVRLQSAPRVSAISDDDISACRAMLHEGSLTFFAASLLLPRNVRDPASALYAFCRLADDVVDQAGGDANAVAHLRARLDAVYAGRPLAEPADRALAAVVARFGIPRALPDALIDGFSWDAEGRRYDTLDALYGYAARVAGTVGAMMALLMGVRSPEGLARACDLGVAMQLSNIARDVGEDARMGRVYLPRAWLREAGIDAETWLANPVFTPALGSVVQRLLDAADVLYRRVDAGVAQLPPGCRPGINAARYLYAEIGHEVARQGCDSVSRRAVVPSSRKAWLLTRSLAPVTASAGQAAAPALDAVQFLVDAAVSAPPPVPKTAAAPPWWNLQERVIWVIALFERLERADRNRYGSPALPANAPNWAPLNG